jgi:hypothetical protein
LSPEGGIVVASDPTAEPTLSLAGFLSFLYGGFSEGFIYCPTLNRETGEFTQEFASVTRLDSLERHIRKNSAHTDVYLSPAIYSEASAKKEHFKASNVVWCEFDGNAPTDYRLIPSVTVRSSDTGYSHCYWRLVSPLDNAGDLEAINRALAYSLGADKSGWDANQILRPPETHNYKRDLPVGVESVSGTIYTVDDFLIYKAPEHITEESLNLGDIPDVMDVIYKHSLPQEFKDVFTGNYKEGQRSTAYMRVGYLGAEAGCSNEELYSLLNNFDSRVGKYHLRQDRVTRLLDIIERVRLKYPERKDEERSTFDALEIYDVISFGNLDIQVEWLLPNLLQQQGSMLLAGPPGVGKTQLALNFAYGLASGTETLGIGAADPCRVLFVSCEMGPVDLKYFTDQMAPRYEEHNELLQENFLILPLGEPLYINTPQGQTQLRRLAETLKLDGIIFDSLGSATTKSLSDEEATRSLLDFNDRFRKDMGVFSWFIHHNRKATENNKEPSGLADIYGSQYITARATTVISLWPQKHGVLKVRELKKRLAPEGPDWYIKRTPQHLGFVKASEEDIATVVTSTLGKAVKGDKSNNPYGI